jgi:signal transduction histidine kinase
MRHLAGQRLYASVLAALAGAGALLGAAAWLLAGARAGAIVLATAGALTVTLCAVLPAQLRRALAPLRHELAQARERQRRLAADTAHVLRGPVARARGQADALSALTLQPGTRRRVELLRFDVDRLARCVETVLAAVPIERSCAFDAVVEADPRDVVPPCEPRAARTAPFPYCFRRAQAQNRRQTPAGQPRRMTGPTGDRP